MLDSVGKTLVAVCQEPDSEARKKALAHLLGGERKAPNRFSQDVLPALHNMAARHGLLGRLIEAILESESELSPDLHKYLSSERKFLAASNLRKFSVLNEIENSMKSAGVESLSLKGLTTSQLAFANITTRHVGDIDLIVRETQYEAARKVILELGFKPARQFEEATRSRLKHVTHAESFTSKDGFIDVDLHWRLASGEFCLPVDKLDVFSEEFYVDICGVKCRTLIPHKLFVYLCFHGSHHGWSSLFWLLDVSKMVLKHVDDDQFWESVLDVSSYVDAGRVVFTTLMLCDEVMGTGIPGAVAHEMEIHPRDASISRSVAIRFVSEIEAGFGSSIPHHRRFTWSKWLLLGKWRHRARYIACLFQIQEADYSYLDLPASLHFLYYLVRPVNLLQRKFRN